MNDLLYDWRVRVYWADNDSEPCAEWTIENLTEKDAGEEAAADVQNEYPGAGDWTMDRFYHRALTSA